MSQPHVSPLHGTVAEREPAFGFMSRIAAVGGLSANDLGKDLGVSFRRILDGEEAAIAKLAKFTSCDPATLTSWTPTKFGLSRRVLRGERFPSRSLLGAEMRGCPICLREDAENSDLPAHRAMTFRADWLVPHVMVCLTHEHALVPLWQETQPTSRFDTAWRFREISPAVQAGELEGNFRLPTDFDEWFAARLAGTEEGNAWLNQHSLHATATFCRLLGFALLRHEGITPDQVAKGAEGGCYQMGFEIASQGEDAVLEALQGLNRLAEPRLGPKAVFPVLYDRLSYDYAEDPEFAHFRAIVADHLSRTWPLGPGDELMGEPVAQRRLHSVRTASEATGVDARRLRKMLEAAKLIDAEMPDAWAVFDAQDGSALLASLVGHLTAKAFAEAFGMSRSQLELLVEDGILVPSLAEAGTKHVWDPNDGRSFLDGLLAGAETVQQAQWGWEHIAKSAQRLKIRPGEVIRAIRDGRIQRLGRNVQFDGYRSVYVYHDEVARVLGSEEPPAMSLEVFSKTVGLKQPIHLNRLVRNGHTPATEMRNPKTKVRQLYISSSDAAAFHAKFVTLRTLAKMRSMSWQKLSGVLRGQGVEPFAPDGADYGNLFLRAEAEAALR